jgi:hypothetical protein
MLWRGTLMCKALINLFFSIFHWLFR